MRTYPAAQCLNRQATVLYLSLAGAGVGVVPTVSAPGAASNLFTATRTAPGEITLTLAESIRDARVAGAVYYDSASGSTKQRAVQVKNRDTRTAKTIVLLVKPAGLQVDEITDALAAATAGLKAATATTVAPQTVLAAGMLTAGKDELAARPRNITFTTAGGTAADAPATATITGTDINGDAQTEVVNVGQTATTVEGVKAFKTITSIVYSAADGTGATVAIGYGNKFGLSVKAKTRAGAVMRGTEIAAGSAVTNGTLVAAATGLPNGTYTPNTAPNGSNDYAIEYEPDGGVDLLSTESIDLTLAFFRGNDTV